MNVGVHALVRVAAPDALPTPVEVSGEDDVHVGRIRADPQGKNGLALFVVGDNLRRGTALNAVDLLRALVPGA